MDEERVKIVERLAFRIDEINGKSKHRNSDDIKATILILCQKESLMTWIMYRGNFSFSQIKTYLKILTDNGLLEVREIERIYKHKGKKKHETYIITEKGRKWLQTYSELKKMENE